MKIEVLAARAKTRGLSLHERLVGFLPRYAPYAARLPWLFNLRDRLPGAAKLSEAVAGFSARRSLPRWRSDIFREPPAPPPAEAGQREVVLFVDTFSRYFEPENACAAAAVLAAGGYAVSFAQTEGRPLCCGRTFLSVGRVDLARQEAERTLTALAPFVGRGMPVLGLEPSCLFSFRDEYPAMLAGETMQALAAQSFLLEEFLAAEASSGRLELPLKAMAKRAMLHGHCHQKSFGALGATERLLRMIPDLTVETIESSCCGMAGAFGYAADTIDVSLAMGELSLLPAVREADADTLVVADGTSCRHQIRDGAGREALHAVRLLAASLAPTA